MTLTQLTHQPRTEIEATMASEGNHIRFDPDVHTSTMSAALASLGFLQALVTVLGNLSLLITIYRFPRRERHTPSSYLISNLGVADLLVGLVIGNLVAARDVFRYLAMSVPEAVDNAVNTALALSLFVSVYTILCMSIDRYVAIVHPFSYRARVTPSVIRRWILAIWLFAVVICMLPVSGVPFAFVALIYANTHVAVPAVLLTILYGMIFHSLSRRKQEIKKAIQNSESTIHKKRDFLKNKKAVITILIILALFYICYLPELVMLNVLLLGESCAKSVACRRTEIVFSRLVLLNSAINPFVYAWRVKKYRQALLDNLRAIFKRKLWDAALNLPPRLENWVKTLVQYRWVSIHFTVN